MNENVPHTVLITTTRTTTTTTTYDSSRTKTVLFEQWIYVTIINSWSKEIANYFTIMFLS